MVSPILSNPVYQMKNAGQSLWLTVTSVNSQCIAKKYNLLLLYISWAHVKKR